MCAQSLHFVNLDTSGVSSKGKASAGIRKELLRWFNARDVPADEISLDQALSMPKREDGTHYALLFYNELSLVKRRRVSWLERQESKLESLGFTILHSAKQGSVIGVKSKQHRVLTNGGVPMPSLEQGRTQKRVFSNAESAAHVETMVLEPNEELSEDRYNTELINTVYAHKGIDYYVCLRSQCVGTDEVCTWVRARPVSDGVASVHTRDTPVDAALITDLHERLVVPNRRQLKRIARRVGRTLGFGFYCHDILPCASSGKLFVCETNFKFYDGNYRFHLRPIAANHPVPQLFSAHSFARTLFRSAYKQLT